MTPKVVSYVTIFFIPFAGKNGMVSRVNFVVTSLCIVISLFSSGALAVRVKSKPIRFIQSRPLDVISTGSIALQTTDSTHIHPHKTTSCVIDRATEHHVVHCRGEKQKTGLTLTASMPAQHLAVETGAEAPPHIHCTPFPSKTCFFPGFLI